MRNVALLILLFTLTGCVTPGTGLRFGKPTTTSGALNIYAPTPGPVIPKVLTPEQLRSNVAQAATNVVGQKQVKVNKRHYRRDCSGSTRGIFAQAGIMLPDIGERGINDATTLYNMVVQHGQVTQVNPLPGDMVFFDNTYDRNGNGKPDDTLSHVGVIEEVLADGTVVFVHYMGKSIIRSRMNLQWPEKQMHPDSGERINHQLRRRSGRQEGLTAGQLFAGFGKIF